MKYSDSREAKQAAIVYYGKTCILSGQMTVPLAGCHIFSAGSNPELKCYSENIVCMDFQFHTGRDNTFDWIVYQQKDRSPIEKIIWLLENTLDEFMPKLEVQLYGLVQILRPIPRHEKSSYIVEQILDERFK